MADSYIVQTKKRQWYHVKVPPHDIDRHIQFTLVRFGFAIVGLFLLVTDIPRTGLGIQSFTDFGYAKAQPSAVYNFGPWAYPQTHVYRQRNTTTGEERVVSDDGSLTLNAWAYKFDSLSIAHRGLAMHLNVSAYPPCILYKEECDPEGLAPSTVLSMLDALITRLQDQYFNPNTTPKRELQAPFAYTTNGYWIDRLHHVMVQTLWKRKELRHHTVYYYSAAQLQQSSYVVCSGRESSDPHFCNHHVGWKPDPDMFSPNASQPIHTHIALRIAYWHQQYPDCDVDLLIFNTVARRANRYPPIIPSFPAILFMTDTLEVTTLLRGRDCSSGVCKTMFIDDYRYERDVLSNNTEEWYPIAALLRSSAQLYVWIRLVCLWVGCYRARCLEAKNRNASFTVLMYRTWATFFKIPSHIIVYGSWPPIVLYAFAHFIDCGVIHLIGDMMWTSVSGQFDFDLVAYIRLASIQMRNIWFVGLTLKCLVGFQLMALYPRAAPWLVRDGIIGMRGFIISMTAWLTIFGNMRALRFRNTDIVKIWVLPRMAPWVVRRNVPLPGFAEFGFRFDIKAICAAFVFVMLVISAQKLLVMVQNKLLKRSDWPSSTSSCRSFYLPYSAGKLWSRTTLCIYWRIWINMTRKKLRFTRQHQYVMTVRRQSLTAVAPRLSVVAQVPAPTTVESCKRCRHWMVPSGQDTQGCPEHEHIFEVEHRDQAMWSMVRMINIAMMTDPLVLLRLYGVGTTLYLYDVKQDSADGPARDYYLLPCPLDELAETTKTEDPEQYVLVDTVSSKAVPWSLLLNCG